ncbi:alpha/beta hydrolase [Winogradskya humida]|uniref:Peptidase n=1 Tax=Winogradskya humida TaxID=113566 RepID=A0ABQ3ZNV4_9ACTN|nr:alpha/beta hydrolase [Actinoplanes humidus]GIE19867.1 peptidase [Actinoplanes humidus]
MRRILTTVITLGLVLSSGAAVAYAASDTPRRGTTTYEPITWGTCESTGLAARNAQCGLLSVPLDYAKPGGEQIELAVSRIRHTTKDADYQGVMLVNPGGPGGSGLDLSVLGEYVPKDAGDAYDWIGFDPRGVGSSEPSLGCDGGYLGYGRPPYVPTGSKIEKAWLGKAEGYASDCAQIAGDLLDHMRTTDTVQDLDSLRAALGAEQINFYGFSYGTYLGQVYATRYPQRVRRMVLDGNVDPRRVWYDANLDQDVAFDRTMKVYFAWIAQYDKVYHLGRSAKAVEKLFYKEQSRLLGHPADGEFGPDELTDVFLQAGYYVFGWESVAYAFSAWVNDRDPDPLRSLFESANPTDDGADNGYAVYLAVQCTDAPWPTSWKKWHADNSRIHSQAPFLTWGNAWYNAPCLTWPAAPGKRIKVSGTNAPPILLLSETLDAATPFSGSLEVRRRFPKSALIEGVGGTTHAGSLFGNACVDNSIAEYLASGKLPQRAKGNTADKRCDPLPKPDPTKPSAKRAGVATLSRLDLQRRIAGY